MINRGNGTGCAGCADACPPFAQMTNFCRKKNFENRTRIDWVKNWSSFFKINHEFIFMHILKGLSTLSNAKYVKRILLISYISEALIGFWIDGFLDFVFSKNNRISKNHGWFSSIFWAPFSFSKDWWVPRNPWNLLKQSPCIWV